MDDHRWSGWPGAYCIDCGSEDPAETCMAVHDKLDFICKRCGEHWPQGHCVKGGDHDVETFPCPEHPLTKCPKPGANKDFPVTD
jgi:hypothetical protein